MRDVLSVRICQQERYSGSMHVNSDIRIFIRVKRDEGEWSGVVKVEGVFSGVIRFFDARTNA